MCGSEGECIHGLFGFEALYRAYLDCRRTKRNTVNALKFEADLYANLHCLSDDLIEGTYRPSRSLCFVARKPKLREIFAADFRDRVVHHLLVGALQPLFEPAWIHDSFACRKGKGTHAAVERLGRFLRQVTRSRKRQAHYLQLDIRSFFMSIHKPTLFDLVRRRLLPDSAAQPVLPGLWAPSGNARTDALVALTHQIIFHDPTANYVYKGDPGLLAAVPSHKSLFGIAKDRGLPIGNLTSQFLAGVYLNELDQFVKRTLRVRWYIRYVDDLVILAETAAPFAAWATAIDEFVREALRLELKPGAQRQGRASDGIDFLGYVIRPSHILVRRRVVNQCKQSLIEYERLLTRRVAWGTLFRFDADIVERLFAIVSGYAAHFARADASRLQRSLPVNNGFLTMYFNFAFAEQPNRGMTVTRRYPIRQSAETLSAQVQNVRRLRRDECLFVRVGAYYEIYDDDAHLDLGLRPLKKRRGFRRRSGFPARALDRYTRRALSLGRRVAVIGEGPERIGSLKTRQWQWTIVPDGPV